MIPSEAKAFINYRVHPAQTIDDVIKEARDVIGDDRVSVEVVESFVPSVVTDYSLEAIPFQIVVNSALEVQATLFVSQFHNASQCITLYHSVLQCISVLQCVTNFD